MFFKTLEIQGFKSFPDKTILTFDRKMTAIVGSNGNGKRNSTRHKTVSRCTNRRHSACTCESSRAYRGRVTPRMMFFFGFTSFFITK